MISAIRTCLVLAGEEADTLEFVRSLHRADFAVIERRIGSAGIALASTGEFQLVGLVCDSIDDVDLIPAVSANVPVLALFTQLSADKVAASLTAGAEACLQLDADPRLVAAQARAVLRRYSVTGQPTSELGVLRVGDILVDVDRFQVECAGNPVSLTPSEFRIIEYLARNPGRVSAPHEILNSIPGGYRYQPAEAREVFKVYARRIRRKLEFGESEPRYLVTVRGFGYYLSSASEGSPVGMAATG